MKIHALRTIASRTATAVGAAVISAVVVAGSLSVAQAATEAIAPNSITSAMIRDGAVKSVDIKDGAITGADITNNSVSALDIMNGQVSSADIADGSITSADVDASVGRPRLAVFVDGTGVVGQLSTSHSTGVASVTNPGVGLYCITPSVSLDLSSSVPIVVGEYYFTAWSSSGISHAGWDATHEGCPSTDIGVRGWNEAGNFNDVSFTVTVP